MVEVVDGDNNLTLYEYDAFGNRTATVYNGQRTEYLIDPFGYGDVIAEYDGDGNLVAKYEHGIGLVSRTDAGNDRAFYDFDGTGSTAALTGIAGTELNSYSYRPFGEDFHEVETVANSFEYIGQWGITEEANGLDFMRARYYDSHSGRFVASDPIGLQGQDSNFYQYVANNPVSYIDPEGTIAFLAAPALGAAGFFTAGLLGGIALNCVPGLGGKLAVAGAVGGVGYAGAALSIPGAGALGGGAFVGNFVGAQLCSPPPAGGATPPPHAEDAEGGFDESEGQVRRLPGCPLILDLDGDGIELTSLENSDVYFDVDGDGFREKTGWLKSDDGLLVFDRNNDGYINDISELFGNQTTGGFTELQELDSNNDGQITAADNNFADLQVWRDFDEDGRSDVNELFSLGELNITKIAAVGNSVNITNEGHRIDETASFELADGTQREVANVWFNLDQLDSYYDHNSTFNPPVVLTEQILNLPDLRGYGNLPSLRIAMANDSTLLNLVQSFTNNVNSGDVAAARQLMRPIMYRWADVDGIDPDSRHASNNVNAQELGFLEKFVGRDWTNPRPLTTAGDILTDTFEQLLVEFETRLLVQVADLPVGYTTTSENFVFSGETTEAIKLLGQVITSYEASPNDILDLEATALTEFIIQEGGQEAQWIVGTVNDDQLNGDATNEFIYGFSGNDTLRGSYGNDAYYGGDGNDLIDESYKQSGEDTLDGGIGSDTLKGMAGSDTYIFDRGYGHDVIEDYNKIFPRYFGSYVDDGGSNDTLIFGSSITRDNLSWNFNGKDLIFTLTDSVGDSLTISNYVDSYYRIENIQVEGSQLSAGEIMTSGTGADTAMVNSINWTSSALAFKGLDGNDTRTSGDYDDQLWGDDGNDIIAANGGNDSLDGGTGNDSINGGAGNDTFMGGEGDDTLIGSYDNDFYQGGAGNDLLDESYKQSGEDTLDGGTGNDTLKGMADSDIYIFDRGYGHDIIEDFNRISSRYTMPYIADGGSNDTLLFGSSITRNNLSWNFNGKDITFTLTDSVGDSLTISNYLNSYYRIENIQVEGSQLTANEIMSFGMWSDTSAANSLNWLGSALDFKGLDGNDTITSGDYDDQLWGDDGDDKITANGGNDVLNGGENNDSLNGGAGIDTLDGGAGDDTLIGSGDNDFYYGGSGDDSLDDGYFESGQDTLDGGVGNDTLRGMSDNDLYIFDRGYGSDVIEDYYQVKSRYYAYIASGGDDTLRFGSGITRNNLRWNFDGSNLVFTVTDSPNDSLTILNYTDSIYAIENIEVDGSLLTTEEILNPQFDESVTIGEFGRIDNFNHNSQTIQLDNSYINPVVFALPLSDNDGDPAIARITDIGSDSFSVYLQEAEYLDDMHADETLTYFVIEAGTWELEDGTMLEVGTVDTNKMAISGWEDLNFDLDFTQTPAIISQVQTNNGTQFVRTRQKAASVDGFELSLEEEEALNTSGHATETVGWLAMEQGSGTWSGFDYTVGSTANVIDHTWDTISFERTFATTPNILASISSYIGPDPVGLRYRNLGVSQVQMKLEEDLSFDNEIGHIDESVDFLAIAPSALAEGIAGSGSLSAFPVDSSI